MDTLTLTRAVLADHQAMTWEGDSVVCTCGHPCTGTGEPWELLAAHQTDQIAAKLKEAGRDRVRTAATAIASTSWRLENDPVVLVSAADYHDAIAAVRALDGTTLEELNYAAR